MPGSTPPTSQLDWLNSTTAMIVLLWSRATRDLLKSFGWGIAALHRLDPRDEVAISRPPPHSIFRFRASSDYAGVGVLRSTWAVLTLRRRDPDWNATMRRRDSGRRASTAAEKPKAASRTSSLSDPLSAPAIEAWCSAGNAAAVLASSA